MARFDAHEYKEHGKSGGLVVDVQTDLLSDLTSRVIVPLVKLSAVHQEPVPRLKPVIRINSEDYLFVTTDIAAVPVSSLGKCVANLENRYRWDITDALDFLFQGY